MSELKLVADLTNAGNVVKEVCISTTHAEDSVCHIWDVQTGNIINTLKRTRNNHGCVSFIPEHLTLISSQSDKSRLFIYDIRKEQPLYECPVAEKITSLTTCGIFCFGGGENGTVYIWNILTGKLLRIFNAHLKTITCMDVNNDFLVTGSLDTLIQVWNLADLLDVRNDERQVTPIYSLSSHSLSVTSVKFTKSSHTRLISTSLDRTCKIWDLSSGIEVCSIVYPSSVLCGVLCKNEHDLFVGCSNGCIYQMNLYPHKPQYLDESGLGGDGYGDNSGEDEYDPLLSGARMVVSELGASSSGTRNLTLENDTSSDGSSTRGSRFLCYTFKAHSNAVTTLELTQDGLVIISGSKDGKLITWDVKSRQPLVTFKKHSITADTEITNSMIASINMVQFSSFHNNENIKQQQHDGGSGGSQKQARNTSSLSIKPFKKFVDTQDNMLEVNPTNDTWSCLFANSDFDLKLAQHFSTPTTNPLPSSLIHQSLSMIKYKPRLNISSSTSRGIQKKELTLTRKLAALQKRLGETEQLYNQQKSINEDLTEIVERYQMKEQEAAIVGSSSAVEKKKKSNSSSSTTSGGFFHRKFQ